MKIYEINRRLKSKLTTLQMLDDVITQEFYDPRQQEITKHIFNIPLRQSLLFCGTCGTGKDRFINIYLRRHFQENDDLNFFSGTPQKLFREIRDASYRDENSSECNAFEHALGYDMLIFRDFGIRSFTPVETEWLNEIIDYYSGNEKPVILSTNCEPSKLKETIGPRIFDRLQMMLKPFNGRLTIPCTWGSYRGRAKSIPDNIKEILTILPPPLGSNSFLCCDICGMPETHCDHLKKLSGTDIINFRNEHCKSFYTAFTADEYMAWKEKAESSDRKYQELYLNFLKKINELKK